MFTEWQRDLVTSTDVVTRVMTAERDWTLPGGPGKKKLTALKTRTTGNGTNARSVPTTTAPPLYTS